jgi:hypothetical protein
MSLLLSVLGRKAKDAYSPVLALLLGRFRKARASLDSTLGPEADFSHSLQQRGKLAVMVFH